MANDMQFKTTVSGSGKNGHEIRGVALEDLVADADFVGTVLLSITGRKPTNQEKTVFNAVLTAAIDHGINPASGFVPRVIAASGNSALQAMAGTLLAIGPYHGGAITPAMEFFSSLLQQSGDVEKNCRTAVAEARKNKQRLMGYGHPKYTDQDPRAQQLLEIARDNGLKPDVINIALMVEQALEAEMNRKLVLNIDGAIAAILLTLQLPPAAGNAIFGLARSAGSIAHILEEQQEKPVRRLSADMVEYQSD